VPEIVPTKVGDLGALQRLAPSPCVRRADALRQLIALASTGELPAALRPRETRVARWIMALRSADALAAGATHQEMARTFFVPAIAAARWRTGSEACRSRIKRLVRAARIYLDDPFRGPWLR
jgi:hypothetical protein